MGRPRTPNIDRFMRLFEVDEQSGCWLWTGSTKGGGYGQFCLWIGFAERRSVVAHRFAYEHFVGPIPEGLWLDHLCNVRHCVNPEHLEPVTARENARRRDEEKNTCPQGHSYAEYGFVRPVDGARCCRPCMVEATRRWRAKNKPKRAAYMRAVRARNAAERGEGFIKETARSIVSREIAAGRLIRPDVCEDCDQIAKVEAHHEDYTQPLSVAWLCLRCHRDRHSEKRAA